MRRAWREFSSLYWGSGLCDDVPALAWFLIVSLVPLALGLTALAALLLGDAAQAQALAARAARVLPRDLHEQLVQLVLRTRHDSPLVIAASLVSMVWVSAGAIGVVERCVSRLIARERAGPVIGKLRSLGLACALACVILLLVAGASAGTGIVGRLGIDSGLLRVLAPMLSLFVATCFCAGLYRVASGGMLMWRSTLTGGLVGGIVLLITPTASGYYLSLAADRTPVGVFLVLAGILFTCYIVALGLLLGAGVSARAEIGPQLAARGPSPGSAS